MEEKKFDTNTAIGLLLIGAVLIYMTWSSGSAEPELPVEAPQEEVVQEEPQEAIEVIPSEEKSEIVASVATDSTGALENGLILPDSGAVEQAVVLENEKIRIVFNSKGAGINSVELKERTTYFGEPLFLIDSNSSQFDIMFEMGGLPYHSKDAYFNVQKKDNQTVSFMLKHRSGSTLVFEYSLNEDNPYQVDFSSERSGSISKKALVSWQAFSLRQEKSLKNERNNVSIFYRSNGDVDDLGVMKTDQTEDVVSADWLAYKNQFFTSLFYTESGMKDLKLQQLKPEIISDKFTAEFSSEFEMEIGEEGESFWFFGPNEFKILKDYDKDFTELIPLGWGIFGWINMWLVIPLFGFFQSLGWNYGIIILIMAVLVKAILSPFQIKSYVSMAKMRVLKPEIDEINAKYDDKMKQQQAMMSLYKQAGANPLGGCLPMLFQMPFLIAMFRFFPASIELRGQSFLWADDLSSYDSILKLPWEIPFYGDHISLFTILMAISMFFYTKMNQQMQPSTGGNQMAQQMKVISYMMPFMMLFWFNSYAAGLSYYYFLANVISFAQQGLIRKFFIDEDAIHAKMQARKEKPQKKGKFQKRLDDMMKDQNRQSRRKT